MLCRKTILNFPAFSKTQRNNLILDSRTETGTNAMASQRESKHSKLILIDNERAWVETVL